MIKEYIKVGNAYYYEFEELIWVLNSRYFPELHVPSKEKPAIKRDFKQNVKSVKVGRKCYWEEEDICNYLSDKLPDIDFKNGFRYYHMHHDILECSDEKDRLELYAKLLRRQAEIIEAISKLPDYDDKYAWEQYQKTKILVEDTLLLPRYLPHEFFNKNHESYYRVYHAEGFHGEKARAYLANMLGVYDHEDDEKPDEETVVNAIKEATKK